MDSKSAPWAGAKVLAEVEETSLDEVRVPGFDLFSFLECDAAASCKSHRWCVFGCQATEFAELDRARNASSRGLITDKHILN